MLNPIGRVVCTVMKKYFRIIALFLALILLCGCKEQVDNTPQLKAYKASMINFFEELEEIDSKINVIDPTDQGSLLQLYEQFDALEAEFKKLAEIEVPEEYISNEALAQQAYEYMSQANEYLHQSFTDTSYNQNVLDAALECYRRANKRVQFIITILHGEIPQDEGITVQ